MRVGYECLGHHAGAGKVGMMKRDVMQSHDGDSRCKCTDGRADERDVMECCDCDLEDSDAPDMWSPEPWQYDDEYAGLTDADGHEVNHSDCLRRAAACVNALAGLNPDAVADAIHLLGIIGGTYADKLPARVNARIDAALAKLKGE
jgi:hypothetical protein